MRSLQHPRESSGRALLQIDKEITHGAIYVNERSFTYLVSVTSFCSVVSLTLKSVSEGCLTSLMFLLCSVF